MEADRDALLEKVKSSFHSPQSEVPWMVYTPDQEGWDETNYFRGKDWSELTIDDFNFHPYCLSFFDVGAFPYFWGAIMYLSLKEGVWECRAMENFLIMWEDWEPAEREQFPEIDLGGAKKVSLSLRSVLNTSQTDLIEEYFRFRCSVGVNYDEVASKAFVASLRTHQ